MKQIEFDNEARRKLQKGIQTLARAVASTLGPRGKNVVLQPFWNRQNPSITKDGVSVAREVLLEDPIENIGALLVKEAAERTVAECGDGTTSSIVLTEAIVNEGFKLVQAGYDAMAIQRGINKAVAVVVSSLKALATPIKKENLKALKAIALISANGDEELASVVSGLVSQVYEDQDNQGSIYVEPKGNQQGLSVKRSLGYQVEAGTREFFFTDPQSQSCVYENAEVLLIRGTLVSADQARKLTPILERASQTKKPLVLFCDGFDGEFMAILAENKIKGVLNIVPVRTPLTDRDAVYEDLAALSGANLRLTTQSFIDNVSVNELGNVKRVEISKGRTTIIAEDSESLQDSLRTHCESLKKRASEEENEYFRDKLKKRYSKLTTGIATIYVGGSSDLEIKERKDRVDDALGATRAALAEGILPGAGSALLKARSSLKAFKTGSSEEDQGVQVIHNACASVIKQILENSGDAGSERQGQVLHACSSAKGKSARKTYDARERKIVADGFTVGIVDPCKVVRLSLVNAASVAGSVLTSATVIADCSNDGR